LHGLIKHQVLVDQDRHILGLDAGVQDALGIDENRGTQMTRPQAAGVGEQITRGPEIAVLEFPGKFLIDLIAALFLAGTRGWPGGRPWTQTSTCFLGLAI